MTEEQIKAGLTDFIHVLALTGWAEARGDRAQGNSSIEERVAVMWVIRNRVQRTPRATYPAVCFAPGQFSCWDAGTSQNHLKLMALAETIVKRQTTNDAIYEETYYLANGVQAGLILDPTNGANHYFAPSAMVPPGRVPAWAVGQQAVAAVGKQLFYDVA